MRTTLFSSVIFAAAALFASACEPEEDMGPGQGPGNMMGQNPVQTANDASTPGPVVDASAPRADAAVGATGGGTGGGFTGGAVGGGAIDAGVTIRTDAAVEAGTSDASATLDGSSPEAGAGTGGWSPCPGGGMPCKILPLGDSITVGLGSSGGGYRIELFKKAHAANQKITFVGSQRGGATTLPDGTTFPPNHEGYSGWTVSQIAGKIPDPGLRDKPNITLVMGGTNDVTFGDVTGAPAQLGMLIDELVSSDPNMLVVVAQVTPRSASFFGGPTAPHPATESYNAALPAVVDKRASEGKHVLLVDMYNGFPMDGLNDSVHPNAKGYVFMADTWYKAIGPYLR